MKRNKLPPTISLEFLLNEVKEQKEEVLDILTVLQTKYYKQEKKDT